MTDFRNLRHNSTGGIDLEISAGQVGWLPFTARSDDPDPKGAAIFAAVANRSDIAPYVEPPPLPAVVPNAVSDRQFFQALALAGLITEVEALSAVKTGDMPSAFVAALDEMPASVRFSAEMMLSGATVFERAHPMVASLGTALGMSVAEIDDIFRAAAAL